MQTENSGNFIMHHVSMDVTYVCNLKCKLCSSLVPYIPAHRRSFSINTQIKALERYFLVVSYVNIFDLIGGEVLLYPHLEELLNYLHYYQNQMGELRIVTNGTLVPSQNILEAVKTVGDKMSFIIDDYGTLSPKVGEIDSLLTAHGIRHIVRNYTKDNPHCGGWVDFGDLRKRKFEKEEAKQLFARCAIAQKQQFCFVLRESELFPCQPVRERKDMGLSDDYSEYLDLSDDSLTLEQQRKKIMSIYNAKVLSACAYCNGMCDDSPRFVPAEQLTQEELKYVYAGGGSYAEILEMMRQEMRP